MRFGIYTDVPVSPDKPHDQLYGRFCGRLSMRGNGFDVYSTIDHHFSQSWHLANPLALFCAAAQHTRRIRSARAGMSCRRKIRWNWLADRRR